MKSTNRFETAKSVKVTNGVKNIISSLIKLEDPFLQVRRNGKVNHLFQVTHIEILGNEFLSSEIDNLGQIAKGTSMQLWGNECNNYEPEEGRPSEFLNALQELNGKTNDEGEDTSPTFDEGDPKSLYFVSLSQVKGSTNFRKDHTGLQFNVKSLNNTGAPYYFQTEMTPVDEALQGSKKARSNPLIEDRAVTDTAKGYCKNLFLGLFRDEVSSLNGSEFDKLTPKQQEAYPLHRLFAEDFVTLDDRTSNSEGDTKDSTESMEEMMKKQVEANAKVAVASGDASDI